MLVNEVRIQTFIYDRSIAAILALQIYQNSSFCDGNALTKSIRTLRNENQWTDFVFHCSSVGVLRTGKPGGRLVFSGTATLPNSISGSVGLARYPFNLTFLLYRGKPSFAM